MDHTQLTKLVLLIDRIVELFQQDLNQTKKLHYLAENYRNLMSNTNIIKEVDIETTLVLNFINNETKSINFDESKIYKTKSIIIGLNTLPLSQPKVQRLYIDGCFDLMHSGHFNAIRQAKQLCEILVVGVIGSAAISKAKGPPIMTDDERVSIVKACKWVDEVVEGVDYDPTIPLLDKLNCSHVAHGDDLVVDMNGEDAYLPFKKAGRMKIFKRTEGISTTDIVGRLLLMTKEIMWEEKKVFRKMSESGEGIEASNIDVIKTDEQNDIALMEDSLQNKILNTTRRIRQFSNNKQPGISDKIIYIDGTFDILHQGHIEILRKAKSEGDFLYVGVYDNETVNKLKGKNFPILNLQERVLNLLSIKYVDEVILGAPYQVTETMIKNFKIQVVVQGTPTLRQEIVAESEDPYEVPKRMGIYKVINSGIDITEDELAERIVKNRVDKKKKKDLAFQENHESTVKEI